MRFHHPHLKNTISHTLLIIYPLPKNMKSTLTIFLFSLFIISSTLSFAGRPANKGNGNNNNNNNNNNGVGGFFGQPGGGFNIPGFGPGLGNGFGGGYGSGFGGPGGGSSKGGIIRSSVVCKEKGPCYKKKLICPAKCFTSYSRSGKGYGGGGGGGGCTIDCKKKCTAYC